MSNERNEQLDLALNFVQFTDKNIFLTGKAGTGKTTFLHHLKKISDKRIVVVAPTGVAAINAGGVTIHSLFQLPFGPLIPNAKDQPFKRFARDKINLIRSLDLLVIDEISMVRADTLDAIDDVLRRYKDHSRPFGGVQLLMIGDLHQLSPVVRDEDWKILKDYYPNLFFFSSRALNQTDPVSIELKHIYRQADPHFIDLLNSVRGNKMSEEILSQLNKRYVPGFKPADDEGYITLTTHNNSAQDTNSTKLTELAGSPHRFHAVITGEFPEYSYPTVPELELKQDAQVMFVKNDQSREKLFYNGKIGRVTRIEGDVIYVRCAGDRSEIAVEPVQWENIKYELNAITKEVEGKIIGSFTQYPLKLAWAITIHKSQGLTFEKAIIDANSAFAHGQVYVALSRCKSLEGMVLSSPISFHSIKTDGTVDDYTKTADENAPDAKRLEAAKKAYQESLIYELFDFNTLKIRIFQCRKFLEDNYNAFEPGVTDQFKASSETTDTEIHSVAETFKKHLAAALNSDLLPEENTALLEKVKKASDYFTGKIENGINAALQKLSIESDNKALKASFGDSLDSLQKELFVKLCLLRQCASGFSTQDYIKTKSNADIDYVSTRVTEKASGRTRSDLKHGALYTTIKSWRDNVAEMDNIPVYLILPQKTLLELVKLLPSTAEELSNIKGMGKIKMRQYGEQILEMINTYCNENLIERVKMEIETRPEKIKADSSSITLEMFKAGKTIDEIATERGFVTGTIENHLANFIESGEISIFEIVPKIKVAKIMAHLVQNPSSTTNEIKDAMGESISYNDIRAVRQHLVYVQANVDEIDVPS